MWTCDTETCSSWVSSVSCSCQYFFNGYIWSKTTFAKGVMNVDTSQGQFPWRSLQRPIFLPFHLLTFECKNSCHGLLNLNCLITDLATFDIQLEHVLATCVHAQMQAVVKTKSPKGCLLNSLDLFPIFHFSSDNN